MMKTISRLLLTIIMGALFATCDTEKNVGHDNEDFYLKLYGTQGNQQGVDLVVNKDGSLILLGNSQDEFRGNQYFIVKTDSVGKILWERTLGDKSDETAVDIEPTLDGNFIIAIQKVKSAGNKGDVDVKLVRISTDGVLIDSVEQGFPNQIDLVKSITPISDGGFLMTGSTTDTTSLGVPETKAFLLRCDKNFVFDPLWNRNTIYGEGTRNEGLKFYEKGTGDFLLFMSSNSTRLGADDLNFFVAEINQTATPSNSRAIPDNVTDTGSETITAVVSAPSTNGYVMVGTSVSTSGTKSVYTVIMGSSLFTGDIVNSGFEKLTIQGVNDATGVSVAATKGAGFLVLANQDISVGGAITKDLMLIKLDASGRPVWNKSFGQQFNDFGGKVVELPGGRILLLGTVTLDSQEKIALMKLNSNGQFLK